MAGGAQPGAGRPPKLIDWNLFEQLCAIQCTQSEIASMLKVHIDTLRDRCADYYEDEYSNVYKKFSENGKCSLRRYQFVLAKTNTSMAIWLGKNWLGQSDRDKNEQSDIYELLKQFVSSIAKDNGAVSNFKESIKPTMAPEQPLLH